MGKVFGIVVFLFGLWASIEVYNEGTAAAFGGFFARSGLVEEAKPGEEQRVGERVRAKVDRSFDEAVARQNRMLGE